ncbi:MAG: 16S rRNA (uracil(1498)-N(3))-methyltransferase [Treponema sp.]|nr:16S rRNA (uracil(1498)-N(3))-methyltransferase [Treponema sp.]
MRQFIADSFPDADGLLKVEGKKARHLVQVLRSSPGDMIYVRLPDGFVQEMTVASVDSGRKSLLLQVAGPDYAEGIQSPRANMAAPRAQTFGPELWLFQFVAKPPKMDLIIRQAAECGVRHIVPVEGTFCQSGPVDSARKRTENGDKRWERIITEAREQSGSPVATEVHPCMNLPHALDLWNTMPGDTSLALVLYEQTKGTVALHTATENSKVERAALFVGAEGGISPEEISYMQGRGVKPVHLPTNILRCETAAVYGMAAMQTALAEKELWQLKG